MTRYFVFLLALIYSCSAGNKSTSDPIISELNTTAYGKMYASVFMQNAAEYKALCFQAYNTASMKVDQYNLVPGKKYALITDIDETVLDNSAYQAHRSILGMGFDQESWSEWVDMAEADSVPGACSFLKHAKQKGIEIFYITNRAEKERSATLKNLRNFGFPDADSIHLFAKQNTSSKEDRRKTVMANYEIVLLCGDDLCDFNGLFDKKTSQERNGVVNASIENFGSKYIILPNTIYGNWESALYNYNYKLTSSQKDSVFRSVLRGYKSDILPIK